jgi:6-pyruvoyltetrahydropterin/6-carboxytetrahydropterin synthase
MNGTALHFTAARGFEAARRASTPGGGWSLAGHGFRARILGEAAGPVDFLPGGRWAQTDRALTDLITPLHFSLLDDRLERVDDAGIAAWLLRSLDAADTVLVSSAPYRGAVVSVDGEARVWRSFRFEAAHRLPNVPPGHKCGRMHGHGFRVTLFARPEDALDAAGLDRAFETAWQPLRERLHMNCLNELPGLENPTSELLARWIFERLDGGPGPAAGVSVCETDSSGCHYDGHRWQIWKSDTFDSAIRPGAAGRDAPSHPPHGHTYTARLHLTGSLDRVLGWVEDFGDVKRAFEPVFGRLDHHPLHDLDELGDGDPASIARFVADALTAELPQLSRVDLLPTPDGGAILARADGIRSVPVP